MIVVSMMGVVLVLVCAIADVCSSSLSVGLGDGGESYLAYMLMQK